jgi:O-antigen/teichoic acid export membrane protein
MEGPVMRNFVVLLLARSGAVLIQFIAFAILAHHLGPAKFGIYTFAIALALMFKLLPAFGLDMTATRDIAQNPKIEHDLIPDIVFVRLILASLSYTILMLLLFAGGYNKAESEAALVAGITLFIVVLEIFGTSLAVRLQFGWIAVAMLVESAVSLVGVVTLVFFDAHVLAFLWLYAVTKAVSALIVVAAGSHRTHYRWRLRFRAWSPLIRTAAPLAAAALLITVYHRIDMALLARLKPEADVGQYGVAFRFYETFLLIPMLVAGVLQPVIAGSFAQTRDVLERRYERAMHAIGVAALPVAVIGGMTAWRVLPELPGFGRFEGAGIALSILAFAAAFSFVSTIVHLVLIAGHLQRALLVVAAISLVVNLPMVLILVPLLSYTGAAIAAAATGAVVTSLSIAVVRGRLGLALPIRRFTSAAGATIPLVGVLLIGYLLHPFVQLALGVVTYLVATFATGALRIRDFRNLLEARAPPSDSGYPTRRGVKLSDTPRA